MPWEIEPALNVARPAPPARPKFRPNEAAPDRVLVAAVVVAFVPLAVAAPLVVAPTLLPWSDRPNRADELRLADWTVAAEADEAWSPPAGPDCATEAAVPF